LLPADCNVIFGDATDVALNGHDNRGVHPGNFDAVIRPRPLTGDADRNGVVNANDYGVWRTNFRSSTQLAADHNANGVVDAADYVFWRKNLGQSAGLGGASSIPEPAAAVPICIGIMALWAFCRPSFARAK
jgi:hypothetical protein